MATLSNLTVLHLERALQIKKQIEALERELQELIDSDGSEPRGNILRARRYISAAGRRRIAQAQRERWARATRGKRKGATSRRKRRMSKAARAKIAEGQRRRWAAVKARKS